MMNGTLTVTRGDHVAIHTHTAAETGWRATSHVIELASQRILVDTPRLTAHTNEVLDHATELGKPITRAYISHAHPDHFACAGLIDAPAYAPASVARLINEAGACDRRCLCPDRSRRSTARQPAAHRPNRRRVRRDHRQRSRQLRARRRRRERPPTHHRLPRRRHPHRPGHRLQQAARLPRRARVCRRYFG